MTVRRFAVVGFGRMGRALAGGLAAGGFELAAVVTRSSGNRAAVRERHPAALLTDLVDLPHHADVIALTVPDDKIEPCARVLADGGALSPGHLVIHLAGSRGLEVLDPVICAGAARAALHPAMTFSGSERDVARLAAPFAVTTDERVRAECLELVRALGGSPTWMPPEQRAIYHAALIFGGNSIVSLVAGAFDILRGGVDVEPAQMLGPVFRACLENVLADGAKALTGPVRRGDVGTLEAHTAAIAQGAPAMAEAYGTLTSYTYGLASRHGVIDDEAADRVATFLAGLDAEVSSCVRSVGWWQP